MWLFLHCHLRLVIPTVGSSCRHRPATLDLFDARLICNTTMFFSCMSSSLCSVLHKIIYTVNWWFRNETLIPTVVVSWIRLSLLCSTSVRPLRRHNATGVACLFICHVIICWCVCDLMFPRVACTPVTLVDFRSRSLRFFTKFLDSSTF